VLNVSLFFYFITIRVTLAVLYVLQILIYDYQLFLIEENNIPV